MLDSRSHVGRPVTRIVLIILLIVLGGVLWQRQAIHDWIRLYGYQSSGVVSQLAMQTTMTESARHVFYVNHPALEARATFNVSCQSNDEHTIVLGCYRGNDHGIYLFDVSDPRLEGVEQVTAAHEMLHAAYERLNAKDRAYVDGLLTNYYEHELHDPRVLDTIAAYKKSEPNDIVNEMHSVFGTEVAALPAPLETYYKRYFTDRAQVVKYADTYQQEFTNRQTQVRQDDTELRIVKSQIDTNKAALGSQQTEINRERGRLDALRSSSNTEAYNAAVPGYNALVDTYNAL